ncbi:50S ribosomal protein L32 [Patescibacteria group bacterium]|nr:50S ribosomal protein L32 [Patescibacteria group bacterium]MBU1758651.1 50S ribosomal protein L32 [Patescibacteria group bacterium]
MTIGPRKKISKTQTHKRHSTWLRLQLQKLSKKYPVSTCKNCGAKKLPHHVCPVCGYYKGKQIVTIKSKSKAKIVDA